MKRKLTVLALACALLLSLAACGGSGDDKTHHRRRHPRPPTREILEVAKEVLAEQGYTLEITEFDDYIMPNTAVEEEELDANYFQHITYMNQFNEGQRHPSGQRCGSIHYEPFGIYAGKSASLDDLPERAPRSPSPTTPPTAAGPCCCWTRRGSSSWRRTRASPPPSMTSRTTPTTTRLWSWRPGCCPPLSRMWTSPSSTATTPSTPG